MTFLEKIIQLHLTVSLFSHQVAHLMKMLKTMHEHKVRTLNSQMRKRVTEHRKNMDKIEDKKSIKQKETKKIMYRALGQMEKKQNKYKQD